MNAVISNKKTVTTVTGSISVEVLWNWIKGQLEDGYTYTVVDIEFPDLNIYPLEDGGTDHALTFRLEREDIDTSERPVVRMVTFPPLTKADAKRKADADLRSFDTAHPRPAKKVVRKKRATSKRRDVGITRRDNY